MAQRLAKDLADPGPVIVSGLARGIDPSARRGPLNATNGVTIGVLGCGIDVVYPKENKRLFDEITQRGAIVTEFPMGTFPGGQNIPIRNRIIAGIALGPVSAELVPVESVSQRRAGGVGRRESGARRGTFIRTS
jgi:DNA processing protein